MGHRQWLFCESKLRRLKLIITVDDFEVIEPDAGVWAHVSLARPDRDPTWAEIKMVPKSPSEPAQPSASALRRFALDG